MPAGMGRRVTWAILLILFIAGISSAADRLSPGLEKALAGAATSSDSQVSVVVFLENTDQINSRPALTAPNGKKASRGDRIRSVTNRLKSYRVPQRDRIFSYLENNSTTPIIEHWIVPAFTATVSLAVVEKLSQMDGVRLLVENAQLEYVPPVEESKAPPSLSAAVSSELNQLNIPYLWQRGLKGKGRLVCSFDTGVEQSHPALSARWRGNHASLESSWFSMVAPEVTWPRRRKSGDPE